MDLPDKSPLSVLVVDDTATNRQILQVFMNKLGFRVLTADDGAQAVERFAAELPDIVLMDVMMPVMDGYEATRRIKALAGERWVPVIFLSALDKEENLVAGLDAGGDDYLAKPVNFVVLDAKLRSIRRTLDLQHRLQAYHDTQQAESALAQRIVDRQMRREGLDEQGVHYWLQPAANFSGDIVAAIRGPGGERYVLLADARGHGLSAAICTLPVLSVFYSLAVAGAPLGTLVREINNQLHATLPVGYFVAATLARIAADGSSVEAWVGGTPDLLVIDPAGHVTGNMVATHLPLGIDEAESDLPVTEVLPLRPGDQVVLCSDGLLEAESSQGENFGFGRLTAALGAVSGEQRLDAVRDALDRHLQGNTPHDDISLLIVECVTGPT